MHQLTTPAFLGLCCATALLAQQVQPATSSTVTAVPRLVRLSSSFHPANGLAPAAIENATLSIYGEEAGGTPLWQETQNVTVDSEGRYSVLLGLTRNEGLPLELFQSGEPRWVGVQFNRSGEVEQRRVLMASVPYALKAADAETLGGQPASAYLLAPSANASGTTASSTAAAAASVNVGKFSPRTNSGTAGSIGKFTNTTDLVSSIMFDTGSAIGVNTTTPADIMHVKFTNTNGALTGYAVQNLGSTATSYSGMLFYDQNGVLGQFQGFNNSTHEYRINNIAKSGGALNGTINFMIGSSSKLFVNSNGNVGIGTSSPSATLEVAGSASATTIQGTSTGSLGTGVYGLSTGPNGVGVFGDADNGQYAYGILGSSTSGYAGYFGGNVEVTGNLSKSGGSFKIDHPLDPANKYLYHSFVESPDMMNVYNGNIVTDAEGRAAVVLPDYFEALNRDYRYQLTVIGQFAQAIVERKVENGSFLIRSDKPNVEVSWQITGVRQDAWANANRIPVDEDKPISEQGYYLHPKLFGQPEERGMTWASHPDLMKRVAKAPQ